MHFLLSLLCIDSILLHWLFISFVYILPHIYDLSHAYLLPPTYPLTLTYLECLYDLPIFASHLPSTSRSTTIYRIWLAFGSMIVFSFHFFFFSSFFFSNLFDLTKRAIWLTMDLSRLMIFMIWFLSYLSPLIFIYTYLPIPCVPISLPTSYNPNLFHDVRSGVSIPGHVHTYSILPTCGAQARARIRVQTTPGFSHLFINGVLFTARYRYVLSIRR